MERQVIIEKFQIPQEGYEIIDQILTTEEQQFIYGFPAGQILTTEELYDWAAGQNLKSEEACDPAGDFDEADNVQRYLARLFHRGIINHTEDGQNWCLGTFYGRLDIFATEEIQSYDQLSREQKEKLDGWYFKAYADWLDTLDDTAPTRDEVLPLEEVLAFIDGREDTPYLASCDCRRLIQNCEQPTDTCITYRTAPNSFVKRGQAVAITKEQAKEIVKKADRLGLIHTINPGGICSCCTDCCYLFRAAEYRKSLGTWPKVTYQIELDSKSCVNCGVCRKRCGFSVFTENGLLRIQDIHSCQGCGLCVTGCKKGALRLIKRKVRDTKEVKNEYSGRI